jgi:hypothetical protein
MGLTLSQLVVWIAVGAGAWLLVRGLEAKGVMRLGEPRRCAACGRQLGRGACPCRS